MIFAFDTETFPIRPGRQAPRVVCVQSNTAGLQLREEGLDTIESILDSDFQIVAHNTAYDVLCTIASRPRLAEKWLRAYSADRVTCTLEREKLIRIAQGSLSRYHKNGLIDLVHRYEIPDPYVAGVKESSVRVGYHALDGVLICDWPQDSVDYALADLVVQDVFHAQNRVAKDGWLSDQYRQARGALWLAAVSAHGMRVDPDAVRLFSENVEKEHAQIRDLLSDPNPEKAEQYIQLRWFGDLASQDIARQVAKDVPLQPLIRPIGTKSLSAARARMQAVCEQNSLAVPQTKTANISLDADSCATTRDPLLVAFARFGSITTLQSRVRRLALAAELSLPIQPRFDNLKETGRTSASTGDTKPGKAALAFGDQTQNLPRDPGLRECYVARPGCYLLSVDWKAAELHALAQTCIDLGIGSQLAKVLNDGIDVHTWFACRMRNWTYEWAVSPDRTQEEKKKIKQARQAAKACNFGFPGGLGIEKFRLFALRQYGVSLSESDAAANRNEWLAAFPEMRLYFNHITRLIDSGQTLVHFKSNRHRGDLRYTSAANSYFQGRVADMLKDAGFSMLCDIFAGFPARFWNEAHDEILIELPVSEKDRVVRWAVDHMDAAGRRWCPDVPVKAEPALQIHWRKGAEPAFDDSGNLIPWEHRKLSEKEIEKILAWDGDLIQGSWVFGIETERMRAICLT